MTKIINGFFSVLKFLLLLVSFMVTFYIIMNMYHRLEKNIVDCIPTMLPFIVLLFLFIINFIFKQKAVNGCLFYNISCCFAFAVILFSAYRSIVDETMVMILKLGYHINFNYFADVIAPMKAMLYLLIVANILLIVMGKLDSVMKRRASKKEKESLEKTKTMEELPKMIQEEVKNLTEEAVL